jgi:hypothetical protein
MLDPIYDLYLFSFIRGMIRGGFSIACRGV